MRKTLKAARSGRRINPGGRLYLFAAGTSKVRSWELIIIMRPLLAGLILIAANAAFAQSSDPSATPIQDSSSESPPVNTASSEGAPQAASDQEADLIIVVPVTGVIDEGVKVVVQRAVEEANARDAEAIFFRVDTPGGRVDSAIAITNAIESAECLTVSYIEGMGAISAGALISYACDKIVMTPGSNIGAATPVMMTPEGGTPLGEKEVSFVRAKMRALAESNGHNPDLAQAMVDKDIELRGYTNEQGEYVVYASSISGAPEEGTIEPGPAGEDAPRGEIILPRGKLLTATPNEAEKYGITEATVLDFEEAAVLLVSTRFYTQEIVANWAEKTFGFLTDPTIAGLLLMLALGGLYFEVKTPGFGVPGIVGLSCLVLLFGAHYVLGLAEVLDLLLILTGITLIVFEVFVIPGFGLAGIAGFASLTMGLYLMLTNVTIPQYTWDYERLADVAWTLIMGLVAFTVFVFFTIRMFPRTPFYRAVVLGTAQDVDRGFTAQTYEAAHSATGLTGTTTTMLRPAGKGRFEGRLYDIVSRGDFLDKGVKVRIVRAEGNRYVVEPVEPETEG